MLTVPDLIYVPDYIPPDEEIRLLRMIDTAPWQTDLTRRVQHYGYRYDYKARRLDETMYLGGLTGWMRNLAVRLREDGYIDTVPDQVIVNEYEAGQGIAPHVDCVPCFDDTILSISLGSPCQMIFEKLRSKIKVPVWLETGSLVVMKGESRYGWKHSIPARKSDIIDGERITRTRRISLTFRCVILSEQAILATP